MTWWTSADLLGGLVLLPALAVTFGRLIATLRRIAGKIGLITDDCAAIAAELDGVPRLAETELLTGAGIAGVVRCTDALAAAL
jgi:hypothetical protein